MNENIVEDVTELLKYIKPNPEKISRLLDDMEVSKKGINKLLGLKEKNDYRMIMDTTLTDTEFETEYPYCFKLVNYLSKGKEFSIIENWINVDKNRMKLSKYLNKFDWSREVPSNIYKGMINELGRNDSSALFDVAKSKSLVISTNMYDFLTSATNTSYRSCYTLDGSHFNGNIAYCRDVFTAIIYTYSKDITRKIGRIYVYIFPQSKTFVVSRVYGSMYNAEVRKATMEIQNRIDANGDWKVNFFEYYSDMYRNARPYYERPLPVYFDAPYTRIFHINDEFKEEYVPILQFKYAYCLRCGRETRNGHYGICERCQEYVGKCRHCNTPTHNDYNINGNKVCPDCQKEYYSECPHCGQMHHHENMQKNPEGDIWCKYCISDSFWYCELCHKLHRKDTSHKIGRSPLCPECWGKYVIPCHDCGCNLIDKQGYRMVYRLNGEKYCKRCYSQKDGNQVFLAGKYRDVRKERDNYTIDNYYNVIPRCGEVREIASIEDDTPTWTVSADIGSDDRTYFYTTGVTSSTTTF